MRKNGGSRCLRACTTGVVALLTAGTVAGCGIPDLIGGGTASPSPGDTAGAVPRTAKPSPRPPARSFPATERLVKRAMAKSDGDAFTKLGCASARKSVAVFGELLDEPRKVLGLADTDPARAIAHRWKVLNITLGPSSDPESMKVIFENDLGRWCVTAVLAAFPGGPAGIPEDPKGPLADRTALARRYLALVNSGDLAEAATFHSNMDDIATIERELRAELKGIGKITIDGSVPINKHGDITLKATRNGEPIFKGTLYAHNDPATGIIYVGKLSLV